MRVLIEDSGKILSSITGPMELVELNTPPNVQYIDIEGDVNISEGAYWDFEQKAFVGIGSHSNQAYVFDYVTKQWIDPRTLDEIKAQKWSKIKSQRNQLEIGGFEFEGNGYDSDQVSQGRILGAAAAGVDQIWTLANNTTVELTAQQLKELYAALQAHIAGVHERGRIARQLIFDAETKEQIESIQL